MTKRITRSSPVDGNLVKIGTPAYLSLVGKPANQRPFPIIRSEDGSGGASPTKSGNRIVRAKRGDSAVIMIMFPVEYDLEAAQSAMDSFGMTGYTIEAVDGLVCAYRSDLQSVAKAQQAETHPVKITRDGITAMVDAGQYAPKAAVRSDSKIALQSIEFDAERFDSEKIIAWGQQNGVDFSQDAIENPSADVISVSRKEVSEKTEVRRMQVEEGVTFAVYRDAEDDDNGEQAIPAGFVAVVNEAAYGNWGWGQLDFAAALADVDFCNAMDNAEYRVGNVIRQILFYSELPLETRKQLVTRCLQQYGAFVNEAIDSLPRQVLLLAGAAVARADASKERNTPINREDSTMKIDAAAAKAELDKIEAARAAEAAAATQAAAAAAPTTTEAARSEETVTTTPAAAPAVTAPAQTDTVTRAELATIVAAAVAEALKQNSAPAAAPVAAAPAVEAAPAAAPAVAAITRDDLTAAFAAAMVPVNERLERIEGTTVVRSAAGEQQAAPQNTAKPENVFRGAFGFGTAKE